MGMLRRARQKPGPGRRAALIELVERGGWDALDERDRVAIERLVRIKRLSETPQPLDIESWVTVPTADQAGVLDELAISEAIPATMRLGVSAWAGAYGQGPIYVSPCLDGWTIVLGGFDMLDDMLASLSRRFNAAYFFEWGQNGGTWKLAHDGVIVCDYMDGTDEETACSPACPVHRGRPPHPNDDRHPHDLARDLAVDATTLGPHTRVRGHATIGLAVRGVKRQLPRGPLEI
jgi:hypothetical protein